MAAWPTQILGNANNTTAVEVDNFTRAMRTVIRPIDYANGGLGIYSVAASSGTMGAGLTAGSPIFTFAAQLPTPVLYVIKKVTLVVNAGVTAFSAGIAVFNLFPYFNSTTGDTGGTSLTASKLRTSMSGASVRGISISSTGTLTAGSRTKDAQPMASILASFPATAGVNLIPYQTLYQASMADYAWVISSGEGFCIEATVPGTGTWGFSVGVVWEEVVTYP